MRKSGIAIILFLVVQMVMAGCRGPEGPTGPTGPQGPAGPGNQAVHLYRVTPGASSGFYDAVVSEVTANNTTGVYSTVTCYLQFDGYDDATMLPYTDTENDASTTSYFFSIAEGKVTLAWVNSGTTTPAAFDLVVTVVNP